MLGKYFESHFTLEQLRNGPSGPLLGGFARSLHEDGYSWWTARTYLRAAHHLGHFLQSEDIALVALQPDTIAVFRRHLKHCHCPKPRGRKTEDTVRGAKCFLRYLWSAGAVAQPAKQPWPALVQGFSDWLRIHRGASQTTISRYSAAAIELLNELGGDPGQYDAERLRAFLLERARRRGVGGTKAILSALRMFLRYLASQGKCRAGLDAAIPAIAGWRLASLPRCLSTDEVEQLLAACDPSLPMGLRDRAVILLLARLGLRASDVAALCFADIDWEDGSVVVKGKSRREVRLPLPQEVGDAILTYLEHRPRVHDEHVFLRCVAPFRGLVGSAVSQIVRRNMRRASVTAASYGSHILRHSAATEMLRRGVSLYDIGSVLRHRSADMSAYYAKVDMELLKQVVQPWPEVLPC
jgi:site-specific recombinase XerD